MCALVDISEFLVTRSATMNSFQSVSKTQGIGERLANGLIAATPVPFDDNGKLHEAGHESYLRHMAHQPIAGVAVWAHTGRGLMLDGKTARKVLRDCGIKTSSRPQHTL